jgi:hypothetical protein
MQQLVGIINLAVQPLQQAESWKSWSASAGGAARSRAGVAASAAGGSSEAYRQVLLARRISLEDRGTPLAIRTPFALTSVDTDAILVKLSG